MLKKDTLCRVKWRCRRGTKELDIMLMRFVDAHIETLYGQQLSDFERLLTKQDTQLIQWLIEQQEPQDKGLSNIVRRIQKANNL